MLPALLLTLSLLLDRLLGEPRRWHPLVGFGWLAARIELSFYARHRLVGVLALILAVLPWVALAAWVESLRFGPFFSVLGIYLAIGWKSLVQHVGQVQEALQQGNLPLARQRVGWIVSRDTDSLDEAAISKAGTESLLENGNDAVFGVIFWFLLLGLPGVILFRLVNTLDALWGYKTERYLYFGWAAARLDDLLNWAPARLTALSYGLVVIGQGRLLSVLKAARQSSREWKSSNAGSVMAAGAVALNVQLGGAAIYHGQQEIRPVLGFSSVPLPDQQTLGRAIGLLNHAVYLWVAVIVLGGFCLVWL